MIGCVAVHIHLKLHLHQKKFYLYRIRRNFILIQTLIKMRKTFSFQISISWIRGRQTMARAPKPAFYPAKGALFIIAKQMHSPMLPCQGHFDPVKYLIAKVIFCDSNTSDDLFCFFRDHLFIRLHNTISDATDRYFLPTLNYFLSTCL